MSKDFVQLAAEVASGVGLLRQGSSDVMRAFGSLAIAATATKAIDTKTKELMALAIGIAVHCDGCVAYHTKMAHQLSATVKRSPRPSLLPLYGRGPAPAYGADALRAYDQFSVRPRLKAMSKKAAQEIAITLEALIDFAHERGLHLNNLYEVGDGVPIS